MSGRKPDFKLKVLNKATDCRCNDAGAAWKNPDGSITIVINPCITLTSDKDIVINLFPAEWKEDRKPKQYTSSGTGVEEDEEPF